jgi:alpha-amylase/alpha-mannosidase (GH57 family)
MTRVAILWHMHQPFYQDLITGEHILPWVRLHGLKDYYGMVALLREFPTVKVTFNLVPSLLVQLQAFAEERARDRHLELGLKAADALTDEERAFCLEEFFHAHRPTMVDRYPRYAELLDKRGRDANGLSARSQVPQFSDADIRDLQVWHKLVWLDPFYLDADPRARGLVEKGRNFTEDDKAALRRVELELLRRIIPEYRDAADRTQVELSTSPFYHPILPLLCDTDIYLRTHPHSRMPRERFQHPADAAEQLARAVDLHSQLFGRRPAGVWPSEGSVSDDIVPLVASAGFRWMATDEEILARTLGRVFARDGSGQLEHPEALYQPYVVGPAGQSEVACAFRDHTLSDLIGFQYAAWSADAAADDFIRRLVSGGRRYAARTGGQEATIAVILDGENAWEHYPGQGRPFLRALYARLASHSELRTVTMSEACAGASERLPSVFPGSWINADFYIWIGHADDHRAWSQLAEARRALESPSPGLHAASIARAREEILIAEGSDWFWWYGDDHSSSHDLAFDDLFRRHVRNVYRALEQPIPEELFVTNITTEPPEADVSRPSGFIQPVIDGHVTSYFEWIGAGCVEAASTQASMHQVTEREPGVTLIEFGFDLEHLYVRVDAAQSMRRLLAPDMELSLNFLKPAGVRVILRGGDDGVAVRMLGRAAHGGSEPVEALGLRAAVGDIAEVQIPFAALALAPGAPVALMVALNRGTAELEHHPRHRPIEFAVPAPEFPAVNWTA